MNIFSFLQQEKKSYNLVKYIHKCMIHSKRSQAYKRRYLNLAEKLADYQKESGVLLYTDSFNDGTAEQFIYYLRNRKENYTMNTIRHFRNGIAAILNRANRDGYKVSFGLHEYLLREEKTEAVYLTKDELNRINQLKLRKEAAAIRDIFLVGCYTAQRFSDYSRLTKNDIINNFIHIKQIKTGAVVKIPLHPIIREILSRNNGGFPRVKSSQSFNKGIKRICLRAGINSPVLIERTCGVKVVKKKYPKYELVTSHTARRTGATLMYLSGMRLFEIMKITGHTTESCLIQYIRLSYLEIAEKLVDSPFFKE